MTASCSTKTEPRWFGLFNDRICTVPRRKVPVSLLRVLASVPADHVLIRDHESNHDEILEDSSSIDLVDGNVFYTRSRCEVDICIPCSGPAKKAFAVDDVFELVPVAELPLSAVLELFDLGKGTQLCRDFESPDDPVIAPDSIVRFEDGPTFLTRGGAVRHIDVVIATTAGFYPAEGFERLPINQPLKEQLARAAKALKITDVAGWISRVGTRELDVEKSYASNGLSCKAEIDYGRRESGGGAQ